MNEQLAELEYSDRLLFIGLWTQADREGRLEDRPRRIKGHLFPYDDLDIDQALGRLTNAGLITRYDRDGRKLICIPTWLKHQKPHIRESDSELPAPDHEAQPRQCSAPCQPVGREGKGREQEGKESIDQVLTRFDVFWANYPKKVGKDAALTEWRKRAPSGELLAQMLASLEIQKRSRQWTEADGKFVPHPRTWLHQGRWQDEVSPATSSVTSAEYARAEQYRKQVWGKCPHDPRCERYLDCINTIAAYLREEKSA